MSDLLEWARRYAAAGISTMPIGDDKKPLVKWTHRQKDAPSDKSLSTDYRKQGVAGIGGITGEVSGDLILVELEAISVLEILDDFKGRLDVLRGEVVLEDAGGGCPAERSVGSVMIVEVDEAAVAVASLGL